MGDKVIESLAALFAQFLRDCGAEVVGLLVGQQ